MTFAVESLMDRLAEKLGVDPIELRLRTMWARRHVLGQGPRCAQSCRRRRRAVASEGAGWLLARVLSSSNGAGGQEVASAGDWLGRGFHTSNQPKPSDVIDFSAMGDQPGWLGASSRADGSRHPKRWPSSLRSLCALDRSTSRRQTCSRSTTSHTRSAASCRRWRGVKVAANPPGVADGPAPHEPCRSLDHPA
jgi:hypothetical protein